jgi:AraC-like DNA-binding protein
MERATQQPFQFELIPPPADIAQWVNTFYVVHTRTSTFEEVVPAYSAQMLIFVSGSACIDYADGTSGVSSTVTLTAPLLRAAPAKIKGPACIVGASFTPLGWARLANLPVDEVHDRIVDAATILPAADRNRLEALARDCAGQDIDPKLLIPVMAQAIRSTSHELKAEHLQTIEVMTQWLASGLQPDLDALYPQINLSKRQVQRLAKRYFGAPPARVVKRQRAIRAAMLLANESLPEELRDEIISTYFDQAHLIRDLRRYTGRTPSGLPQESLTNRSLNPKGHGSAAQILRSD